MLNLLVRLHVLLAAESLSTDVAVVEAGGVASLDTEQLKFYTNKMNSVTSTYLYCNSVSCSKYFDLYIINML